MNLNIEDILEGGCYHDSFMTPKLFDATYWFKNHERYQRYGVGDNWGDINRVKVRLVYWVDELRCMANAPVTVHCAYEDRSSGFHPQGEAADIHVSGMSVLDQFILASKLPFMGIGLYPYWNSRGLHVDIRSGNIRYDWYRDKQGVYYPFNSIKSIHSGVWVR